MCCVGATFDAAGAFDNDDAAVDRRFKFGGEKAENDDVEVSAACGQFFLIWAWQELCAYATGWR
jgi:hypothetical protein